MENNFVVKNLSREEFIKVANKKKHYAIMNIIKSYKSFSEFEKHFYLLTYDGCITLVGKPKYVEDRRQTYIADKMAEGSNLSSYVDRDTKL